MNSSELRKSMEHLLQRFADAGGAGPDPYHDEPQIHPMAEGKYLLALAACRRSAVLGAPRFERFVNASVDRLRSLQAEADVGTAFGLGFAWNGASARTPYLITTSIVADGLAEASRCWEGEAPFADLLEEVLTWMRSGVGLTDVETAGGTVPVPVFDPVSRLAVVNAIAYWAGVLADHGDDADRARASQAIEWVIERHLPVLGWPYGPDSVRLDLLHTCYIGRGLRSFARLEGSLISAVSQFEDRSGFLDKIDVTETESALETVARANATRLRWVGPAVLIVLEEDARPWSLGELLVLGASGFADGQWRLQWRAVVERALSAVDELLVEQGDAIGPRHAMHLAHGLARVLEERRSEASS